MVLVRQATYLDSPGWEWDSFANMKKIRILLVNYPQMMRALMREVIERQPDMEIVGETVDPLGLLLAARQTRAEAVIMTLRNSEDRGLISHLLAECPGVTILRSGIFR
jgi:chemotaxis response regulator CheB